MRYHDSPEKGIAPTYHIELLDRPTIVWDFQSLLLGVQMMFSFMVTDEKSTLKVCKHCGSALIKDETIWLTQKAMAELFGIDKSGISRHLAKIFETGELDEENMGLTTWKNAPDGCILKSDTPIAKNDLIEIVFQ